MKLLIDIGNSRLHWAVAENGHISERGDLPHADDGTPSIPTIWRKRNPPQQVYGVSVATAAATERVSCWIRDQWGIEPIWLSSEREACGVINGYENPTRLGNDRWAALMGASVYLNEHDIIVISCGTAMTIDFLTLDGQHLGGWITPGPNLMRRCLIEGTAGVAATMASSAKKVPGRDTAHAVANGIHTVLSALVKEALEWARLQSTDSPLCLITGGCANLIELPATLDYRVVPDLVFIGLLRRYERNDI